LIKVKFFFTVFFYFLHCCDLIKSHFLHHSFRSGLISRSLLSPLSLPSQVPPHAWLDQKKACPIDLTNLASQLILKTSISLFIILESEDKVVLSGSALLLSNLAKPVEDIGIRNGLRTKTLGTVHKKLVLVGYQVDDNFVVFAIRAYELFIHPVVEVASGRLFVVEGQLAVALPFAGVAVDVFEAGDVWEESFVLLFAAGEFGLHASLDADEDGIFLGKGSGESEHFLIFF